MSVDYSLILAPIEDIYQPSKDKIIKLINYLAKEELIETVANPFRFSIYKSDDRYPVKPYSLVSKMSPEEQVKIALNYMLIGNDKNFDTIAELLQEINLIPDNEYIKRRWMLDLPATDRLRSIINKDKNGDFNLVFIYIKIGLQIYYTSQDYKYHYDIKNSCYRDKNGNTISRETAQKQIVQAIKSFSIEFFSNNHTPYGDETTTYDYYNYHEYLLTFPDVVELKNKISEIIEADTMFTWIYSY